MIAALIAGMLSALLWADAHADELDGAELPEPVGRYLQALEESGRLPVETATAARLAGLLVQAETYLVRGDAGSAATLLFGVVESPRFRAFESTAAFQNAEFLLGRALFMGRAHRSAVHYLDRVLARGMSGSYFVPAVRMLVNLALDTGQFDAALAAVERAAAAATLPGDSADELAYLRGRSAYRKSEWLEADGQFRMVSKTSRLYSAALYFRGLVEVQNGNLGNARANFCEVADQRDQDRLTFNVDERFFRLKDLARLALGRIAHEQDHYDEAYYFYFSIPEESDRLPAALFEASWSMLQKGEFAAARAFADQFDKLFPHHPLAPEVSILRANLAVRTCAFDSARTEADALVRRYLPVQELAAKATADRGLQDRIVDRLLSRQAGMGDSADLEGRLIEILKLDPQFDDLVSAVADSEVDIAGATRAVKLWRELGVRAEKTRSDLPVTQSSEAIDLLEQAVTLASQPGVSRDPDLGRQAAQLVLETSLHAYPPEQAGPYAREAQVAERLVRELTALRSEMIKALQQIVGASIAEADQRLRAIMRQTRLVHIDAVVGKKKKLEIEIGKLAEGELTAEAFRKLHVEGQLGDDEIYWPFEGEMWADEYENYR